MEVGHETSLPPGLVEGSTPSLLGAGGFFHDPMTLRLAQRIILIKQIYKQAKEGSSM